MNFEDDIISELSTIVLSINGPYIDISNSEKLLEDFSGVQDENGNPHGITTFSLTDKAALIKKLKEIEPKFSSWFASHCEAAEKKITEVAVVREVVESGSVQSVQG
ncbi:MAG: hypothetical protein FWB90_01320 [Fibromonadales bacterium]|nr:hypothetical protein [Fibromonadales bacterium]